MLCNSSYECSYGCVAEENLREPWIGLVVYVPKRRLGGFSQFDTSIDFVDSISFVMPAWNSEATIQTAVGSCLAGMKSNDELIIIDDASSDGTSKFLSTISDSRVSIFRNEFNEGVARSLNRGLKLAQNELIARMDSDDIMLPWRRRLSVRKLSEGQADFIFTTAIVFGQALKLPLPQLPIKPAASADFERQLAISNPFVHSTMLTRLRTLEKLDFYSVTPMEDYDLWIRAALQGFRFAQVPIPCLLYRQHPAQVTKSLKWSSASVPDSLSELRRLNQWQQEKVSDSFVQRIWKWNQRNI